MAADGAPVTITIDAQASQAVAAWNLMDGKIEWSCVDVVAELVGCHDIDALVVQLIEIRRVRRAHA